LRFGARHLGGVGTRIDGEQRIALVHQLALAEMHLHQGAGHARADVDRVRRFEAGGELIKLLHVALDHGGHRHRRRSTAGAVRPALVMLATSGQRERMPKHIQCESARIFARTPSNGVAN
jgi:hypothetical protein